MRLFENPNNFFFRLAEAHPHDLSSQHSPLQQQCGLCSSPFDFKEHLPRILIHCGHTFCEKCISMFHRKGKVRCAQCHKLVKHIEDVKVLPINHSIFSKKVHALRELYPNENFRDPSSYLFQKFQEAAKTIKERNAVPMNDPETGLPFCLQHSDRVQHFYCSFHNSLACRVCAQTCHKQQSCSLIQLYQVGNINQFLAQTQSGLQQQEMESLQEILCSQ